MKVFKWIAMGFVGFVALGIVVSCIGAIVGVSTAPVSTATPVPTLVPTATPDPVFQAMARKESELHDMLAKLDVEAAKIDELVALCPSYMWEVVNYHVDEFTTLAGRETYKLDASASLDERYAVAAKVLVGAISTRKSLEKVCLN